jgi:hypothetical protein
MFGSYDLQVSRCEQNYVLGVLIGRSVGQLDAVPFVDQKLDSQFETPTGIPSAVSM